jgi:hypothetical protein
VLGYAIAITGLCELIAIAGEMLDDSAPIHIEVLVPAFALGCLLKRPRSSDCHSDDVREGHQEGPESTTEQRVSTIVAAVFMLLVGLNMPPMFGGTGMGYAAASGAPVSAVTAAQPALDWGPLALHVVLITVLANLGKMMPALCYRDQANWRERLALAICMWPRGEVGAGILVISLGYGIGGPILTVAMLSLSLNLLLTGVFVLIVKKLMQTPAVTGIYPHLAKRTAPA